MEVSTSPEFLVEGILPANEIHLLGGSSGSGKTTLIFQTLADWQDGESVFGHESHPVPYAYLSLDRSRSSVTRTLERLGLEAAITRVICQEEFGGASTITQVIDAALKVYPDATFFVVEGFQTMVGDKGNSYAPVANLLRCSATLCAKRKITILGIAHSPKMKMDEGFQHSRELILGSVAWGAYSDTIITVQLEESSGNIKVKILPRNAASEDHNYVFGYNGILVPLATVKPVAALKLRIEALSEGSVILRSEIIGWAKALKVSERTGDRALKDCVKNQVLVPLDVGTYERSDRPGLKIADDHALIVDS